jgi:hypothetical protein
MEDPVRYMMFICVDTTMTPRGGEPTIEEWVAELEGKRIEGSELMSIQDATTVRKRDEEVLLSDGPFAETKEHIVGYDIIECADLDEAIHIAGRHPVARFGAVEVRPFPPQ